MKKNSSNRMRRSNV
uniref:Uncharacterized protein n=1 Tax=Triatoma infestans TaxID=30076 RepID=A0A170XUK7_TRIIF